jgi:hypothetical protein
MTECCELVEAASNEEWEKVEVRRALEAALSSERGPSSRLGLGQWTLEAVHARLFRPCSAESSPSTSRLARLENILHAGAPQYRSRRQVL